MQDGGSCRQCVFSQDVVGMCFSLLPSPLSPLLSPFSSLPSPLSSLHSPLHPVSVVARLPAAIKRSVRDKFRAIFSNFLRMLPFCSA
jgi:hypothetical protein